MVYHVYVEPGEDFGYVAHCPAIPGCSSQGDSLEEALDNIRDAIRGCLEALDPALIPPRSDRTFAVDLEIAG
ncbi:MAG: type II toxin-antitoxin system HicB family antitoxin [Candidatus Omnitrophica bacterium]|nr:type II toxin-antitoxin system HicB family antitoxin [Candidatus Omnitrophota bacterium]